MPDYRAYAFNAAVQNGLNPPEYFVNQINQESGFNPNAYNAGSDASGIAQIVPRWHPGVDVWNPYQSLDYAAKLVASNIATYGSWSKALIAYNWGPGNMANSWDGTFQDLPDETQHYLQIILGQDQINKDLGGGVVDTIRNVPDVPDEVIKQVNPWECSVRTGYAALWLVNTVVGRPSTPSYPEFSRGMVPKYADPDVGLKDGSGAGLAEYLRSWGLDCFNVATLSRQACVDYVKQGKLVCIGGHSWYHWALAVGYESDGTVVIENPAPGYQGITTEILNSWDTRLGPFSGVVITIPSAQTLPPPAPTPQPDARDAQIAALRKQVADLSNLVGNAYNKDGEVRKALKDIRNKMQDIVLAMDVNEDAAQALDSWLEANRLK